MVPGERREREKDPIGSFSSRNLCVTLSLLGLTCMNDTFTHAMDCCSDVLVVTAMDDGGVQERKRLGCG